MTLKPVYGMSLCFTVRTLQKQNEIKTTVTLPPGTIQSFLSKGALCNMRYSEILDITGETKAFVGTEHTR